MSSRRPKRHAIPMMPMDNLSSPPLKKHHHTYESLKNSTTRYKKGARSIAIPEKKINLLSSRNFIPSSPSDDNNSSHHNQEEVRKSKYHDEQFEPIIGSSPLRKPDRTHRNHEKSEGLLNLSSSPSSISRSPNSNQRKFKTDIIKYNIPGILDVKMLQKDRNHIIKPISLIFNDDNGVNPYLTFTQKGVQLSDIYVDFNRDCERIIFDHRFSRFVIIFQKERQYSYDRKSGGMTKILVWINLVPDDAKILKRMKSSLMKSNAKYEINTMSPKDMQREVTQLCDTLIKERKQTLAENAMTDAFNEQQRNSRSPTEFLKKSLSSLQNKPSMSLSQRSSTRTGRSIPIPRSQNLIPNSNISTDSFYSNRKSALRDQNLDDLRRSNRKRKNVDIEYISQTKEQQEEIPQIFKPKLKYQFSDETKYTITNQDFKCLYNNDWINDTLIDFFTKYYDDRASNNRILKREEVCIITSFFYTKLVSDPENYYENVKKWVQNTDLSTKKYIIIPININYHWFGCIIYNFDLLFKFLQEKQKEEIKRTQQKENGTVTTESVAPKEGNDGNDENHNDTNVEKIGAESTTQKNGNEETEEKKKIKNDSDSDDITELPPICQILTFDSLRGIHSKDLDPIKEFLIAYAKDKFSLVIDKSWIKMKTCQVPQQPNMSDCGVHVILTIKKFFEKPEETIKVWNSINRKSKENSKLINEYFEKNRRNVTARKELREKLLQLQENQVKLQKDKHIDSDDSDCNNNKEDDYDDEDLEIIENIPEHPKNLDKNFTVEATEQESTGEQNEETASNKPKETNEQNHRNDINSQLYPIENEGMNDSRTSQLSSVPPSPTPSKRETLDSVKRIETENTEAELIPISVKVNLRNRISDVLPETVISSEDKIIHSDENGSHDDFLTKRTPNKSAARISSKYFRSHQRPTKTDFKSDDSPLLSDHDYRTARTDESQDDEISPLKMISNKLGKSAVDYDDSQNIVVSDVEADDDVNLIGRSSNAEIDTTGNTTPIRNNGTMNGLEEDDNIETIKNDINKKLYTDDSHHIVDLSSPTKAEQMDNITSMNNISSPPGEPSDSSDSEKAQHSILID
ncbi:hypothetical protein C6P45_003882 [Maudiozyma exigua]|uniref:Ubiquitin-like protease family profile domain-containing protein n=1 Tax=Maudiozyma exigua TaxID=34358 RepID=A0A9P6WB91_MAUEX|nr:hypothetical protein C6P45_003882 [Kazachstania exigua]